MARPKGVRNADFEEKRHALVTRLTDFALNNDAERLSLRQFAIAAEVTEPTLRHYFGDRTHMIIEILKEIGERGEVYMSLAAAPESQVVAALQSYYDLSGAGLQHGGFERAHLFGLLEGAADPELGEAYLRYLLEPSLKAVESKIGATPEFRDAPPEKVRTAALMVFAPLLLYALHQKTLGGRKLRPLALEHFLEHVRTLLAHGLSRQEPARPELVRPVD